MVCLYPVTDAAEWGSEQEIVGDGAVCSRLERKFLKIVPGGRGNPVELRFCEIGL